MSVFFVTDGDGTELRMKSPGSDRCVVKVAREWAFSFGLSAVLVGLVTLLGWLKP